MLPHCTAANVLGKEHATTLQRSECHGNMSRARETYSAREVVAGTLAIELAGAEVDVRGAVAVHPRLGLKAVGAGVAGVEGDRLEDGEHSAPCTRTRHLTIQSFHLRSPSRVLPLCAHMHAKQPTRTPSPPMPPAASRPPPAALCLPPGPHDACVEPPHLSGWRNPRLGRPFLHSVLFL